MTKTEPNNRSRPWLDEEFIRVDGFKLVYTASKRRKPVVHMPGGKTATFEQLKALGYRVVLPEVWRESEFI